MLLRVAEELKVLLGADADVDKDGVIVVAVKVLPRMLDEVSDLEVAESEVEELALAFAEPLLVWVLSVLLEVMLESRVLRELVALVSVSAVLMLTDTAGSVDGSETSLLDVVEMTPGATPVTPSLVEVFGLDGSDEDAGVASSGSEIETVRGTEKDVASVLLEVDVAVSSSSASSEARAVEVVLGFVLVSGSGDVEEVLVEMLSSGSPLNEVSSDEVETESVIKGASSSVEELTL